MRKTFRKFLKLPLTLSLRMPFVRKRAAFHFRQDYFSDLDINIPLGQDFWCPIRTQDSIYSFSEIFVANEYGSFLDRILPPRRWIDLGAHTGYFSLYLAWQRAVRGENGDWKALLIDADPRMQALCKATLGQNNLLAGCEFRSGLISSQRGEREFALREGMGSSFDIHQQGVQGVQRVRVIDPAEILKALPPPYDLIKIDIEGAEFDFVESYGDVYKHASSLLMEWHSPDKEGTKAYELRGMLEAAGFRLDGELRPTRVLQLDSGWFSSGVQIYRRDAGTKP